MALLLLAAILATLLGAPARVSAAPSVDTWAAPNPPQVEAGAPVFYDVNRHTLTMIDVRSNPGRIWRFSDQAPRKWIPTDLFGNSPDVFPVYGGWAYDPKGDRVFQTSVRMVFPPCCVQDTAQARAYLEVYQLSLGGPAEWQLVSVPDRPLVRDDFSAAFDVTRNRLVLSYGFEDGFFNPGSPSTSMLALELDGSPHWTVLQPPGAPLWRRRATLFVDEARDRFLSFGGEDPSGRHNELWALPLSADRPWEMVAVEDTLPPLGTPHIASIALDRVHDRILLQAPYFNPDFGESVGFWQLGLDGGLRWARLGSPGSGPFAAYDGSLVHDPEADRLYLYGGYAPYNGSLYDGTRFDLFRKDDIDAGSWQSLQLCGEARSLGEGTSVVLDTRRRRAIALPGYSSGRMQIFTIGQGEYQDWESPQDLFRPTDPSGRAFATVAYDSIGDRTLVFGGRLLSAELGDLWQLKWPDPDRPEWTRLYPEGTPPSPRYGASSVYDPVRRRIILFGGFFGKPLADTWALELDGTLRWHKLESRGLPPSARYSAGAVYDSRRDGMIVYGGNANTDNDAVPLGDAHFLSFLDGDVWVPMTIANSAPVSRWMHAAMYDPVRDRMLVLWGRDRTGGRFDCAALDLSGQPSWAPYSPEGPATDVRYGHSIVYDAWLDRALILGGARGGYTSRPLYDWYLEFAPGSPAGPGPGPPLALLGMTPNPTHAGVDVAFDIPASMPVRVRLYDARGRLVKSVDEKVYPPGRHLVHWDGTAEDGYRPRPGVYFARLVLGTSEFTGKVVLLR